MSSHQQLSIRAKLTRLWDKLDPLQVVQLRLRWSLIDRLERYRSFHQQPVEVRLQRLLLYFLCLLAQLARFLTIYLAASSGRWEYFHQYDRTVGFFVERRKYSPLIFLPFCLVPLFAFIPHYLMLFRATPRFWNSVHRLIGDPYRRFLDDNSTLIESAGHWPQMRTCLKDIKNSPLMLIFRKLSKNDPSGLMFSRPIPGLKYITRRTRCRLILVVFILDITHRLVYVVVGEYI